MSPISSVRSTPKRQSRIEYLLRQLETAEPGSVGAAKREAALSALRSMTDLDWGDDAAAWRDWWNAVRSLQYEDYGKWSAPLPRASADAGGFASDGRRRRSRVPRALHFLPQFGNLESDLTYYLRNHSGPSIWLNAELDSYCRGTNAV